MLLPAQKALSAQAKLSIKDPKKIVNTIFHIKLSVWTTAKFSFQD